MSESEHLAVRTGTVVPDDLTKRNVGQPTQNRQYCAISAAKSRKPAAASGEAVPSTINGAKAKLLRARSTIGRTAKSMFPSIGDPTVKSGSDYEKIPATPKESLTHAYSNVGGRGRPLETGAVADMAPIPSVADVLPFDSEFVDSKLPHSHAYKDQAEKSPPRHSHSPKKKRFFDRRHRRHGVDAGTGRDPRRKEWFARRRCLYISLIVIGVATVLGIGIGVGVGVHFSKRPKMRHSPAKSPYDVCFEELRSMYESKHCVAASAPSTATCKTGVSCTIFNYHLSEFDNDGWKFNVSSRTKLVKSGQGQLCRSNDGQSRLGVCSDGACTKTNAGKIDASWNANATWEDNCDIPNPCWRSEPSWGRPCVVDPTALVTRNECKSMKALGRYCNEPGMRAVVWIEHRRCKLGNNKTTIRICQGLPLRLWRCALCERSRYTPVGCPSGSAITLSADKCSYSCDRSSPHHLMPSGAECRLPSSSGSAEAYCYMGNCMPVEVLKKSDAIPNKAECEKRKKKSDMA